MSFDIWLATVVVVINDVTFDDSGAIFKPDCVNCFCKHSMIPKHVPVGGSDSCVLSLAFVIVALIIVAVFVVVVFVVRNVVGCVLGVCVLIVVVVVVGLVVVVVSFVVVKAGLSSVNVAVTVGIRMVPRLAVKLILYSP